jgi:hypothetical protein
MNRLPGLGQGHCHEKRHYLLREQQRTDPVASRARKAAASPVYQFRRRTAPIGPYLGRVWRGWGDRTSWCGSVALKPASSFSRTARGGTATGCHVARNPHGDGSMA